MSSARNLHTFSMYTLLSMHKVCILYISGHTQYSRSLNASRLSPFLPPVEGTEFSITEWSCFNYSADFSWTLDLLVADTTIQLTCQNDTRVSVVQNALC